MPLLQEYSYEDYAELESYIGPRLVDVQAQTLNADLLANASELVDALRAQFQPGPVSGDTVPDLVAAPTVAGEGEDHPPSAAPPL